MPHFWGKILVVTKDELIPKYFNTLDSLKWTIKRYADKPYGIKKVQKGGNGRQMLIDFDSLSMDIQNSLGDPRKMQHPLIALYQTDATAARFFSDFQFEDGTPLKLESVEKYTTNASVLAALVKLRELRLADWAVKGKKQGRLMQSLWMDATTFNEYLPKLHAVTHTLPKGERQFDNVFKSFLNSDSSSFNYKSLISGKERNQNALKMTDEMISLLNDLFAGQDYKPTRTDVFDKYNGFLEGKVEITNCKTGEVYNHTEKCYKALSEASVINWLARWEYMIGAVAKRSNDRQKTIQKYIPYHKFTKLKESGLLLSVDDRNPPFIYNKERDRVWFYMAIDVMSEAWTAWVWAKSKKDLMIEFYRQIIRNYTEWGFNLPLELECESNLNSSYKNTFLNQGAMFDTVTMYTHYARGKAVERKFGELRYRHEKEHIGWMARPFSRKEDNSKDKDDIQIVPYENIIKQSLMDIQKWNNMEHNDIKNKSRWEVFCENQSPKTKPTNWKAILPHLGKEEISSCNAGIINFRNSTFVLALEGEIALGDELIRLMKQIEGKEFTIFWLDGNDGNVLKAMIYHNGMMLCDLISHPAYSKSKYEREDDEIHEINMRLMSAYENTVTSFMANRKREITTTIVHDKREKTINNFFTIPGLETYQPKQEPAEVVETEEEEVYNIPAKTSMSWARNFGG